jgi:hypothetical protein
MSGETIGFLIAHLGLERPTVVSGEHPDGKDNAPHDSVKQVVAKKPTERKKGMKINYAILTDDQVVNEHLDLELMRRKHLWSYGSFLPLKHRVAVDAHGISRMAILCHVDPQPKTNARYVFLPEANMYSIPDNFWTNSHNHRRGQETLLFQLILEGWVVA